MLESEQSFSCSDGDPLELEPLKMFSQNGIPLFLANSKSGGLKLRKISESLDLLEVHGGILGGSGDDTNSCSISLHETGAHMCDLSNDIVDLVPSSRFLSNSNRYLRYQTCESFQKQLCSSISQISSSGSVDYYSESSQTSSDQTEKSNPSSLILSRHKSKKAFLQSSGHIKISAYWNVGLLTIHVIQARCLSSSWKSHCDSYVKLSMVPDESGRTRCKTRIQLNTNSPMFDEKFSLEILEEDRKKRLLISVWHKDANYGASEFLGCMSFGVGHLLKKDVDGWYYLLTEEVGRKKYLQAQTSTRPMLTVRSHHEISQENRAVDGQEKIKIAITRGKNGFGFSFVNGFPPKVGRVDKASPADHAGVKKGDLVIRINEKNVSRSTSKGVAYLVKKINSSTLTLELLRDHTLGITTDSQQENHHSFSRREMEIFTANLNENLDSSSCDQHKEDKATVPGNGFYYKFYSDDEPHSSYHRFPGHLGITSTPRLLVRPGYKVLSSQAPSLLPLNKHETLHHLMSLELDYIEFMHHGIERYVQPLRYSILSEHQHLIIFQNIEMLVSLSEYHISQMHENNSFVNLDTDDSQSSESSMFPNSVALIYHSKINMLSQAYKTYVSGLAKAKALLEELRENQEFIHFVNEDDSIEKQCSEHPSVSAFISRPVLHIQVIYSVLKEIFSATTLHSPDFAILQNIVIKMSQEVSAIIEPSIAGKTESLDSLTSFQSQINCLTSNETGSIVSETSTCLSETGALCPLVSMSPASFMSVDKDMLHIQRKLVFTPGIHPFQLLQEGRYLIYRGEIYIYNKGLWVKSQLILFSDMLLVVNEKQDGSLCVTTDSISVRDIAGIDVNRTYASEFVIYYHVTASGNVLSKSQQSSADTSAAKINAISIRGPSSHEKFVWKSLLEQPVSACNGSQLHQYGSTRNKTCRY